MFNRLLLSCAFIFLYALPVHAQQKDSTLSLKDITKHIDSTGITDSTRHSDSLSTAKAKIETNHITVSRVPELNRLLNENLYLNSSSRPVYFLQTPRKGDSKDIFFYALLIMVLLFAMLKFFYSRYFGNLFRVFFNTSLRQSQLTDQLLQAKLPSLLFNIFFILIGGCYLYMLLYSVNKTAGHPIWSVFLISTISLAAIYTIKFCSLKFTGWITGYKQEADTYIFITFLINKIIAICLIPLVIVITFSDSDLANIAIILSFVIIASMILMRFFRSYSLLQNRLKISRFHFFIYIIGIEIIPILVIYKLALIFISKNL